MGTIILPENIADGETSDASKVMSDLNTIVNVINGNLEAANIAAAAIGSSELATNAVETVKILAANITAPKLENPLRSSFRGTRGSTQSINTSSWTQAKFTTEDYDNLGEYTPSTGLYTAKQACILDAVTLVTFEPDSTGYRQARLVKNSSAIVRRKRDADATLSTGILMHTKIKMAVSDTLKVEVWQNSGSGIDLIAGEEYNYFVVSACPL